MVQKLMAPGSFFKSSAKKAEECHMKRISTRQTGGLWMPGPKGWAHAILLAQPKQKPGSTPNEMMTTQRVIHTSKKCCYEEKYWIRSR